MRYWFDTEFHDDGHSIALISIGVVAEDGREYYAANLGYDPARAHEWLRANVLPFLPASGDKAWRSPKSIKSDLESFFARGGTPEFWADCGEYDWIVLRQLWGELTSWPQGWPFLAMDIEQWRLQLAAPAFPSTYQSTHHALQDARSTRANWLWLKERAEKLSLTPQN